MQHKCTFVRIAKRLWAAKESLATQQVQAEENPYRCAGTKKNTVINLVYVCILYIYIYIIVQILNTSV